jgi:hypothetical protein
MEMETITRENMSMACLKALDSISGLMAVPIKETSSKASAVDMAYGSLARIVWKATEDTIAAIKKQATVYTLGTMDGNTKATSKTTTETAMDSYMTPKDRSNTKAFGKMVNKQIKKQ